MTRANLKARGLAIRRYTAPAWRLQTGGELIILAPGVKKFGEDAENDRLIRKYGYAGRERVLELVKENDDLRQNLSVAAHLIHGSSDGRFKITYAAKYLSEREITSVNYAYMQYERAYELYANLKKRYEPCKRRAGLLYR